MTATAERPDVLALVGPTGVGKTAVAERLALRWRAEIVSADSMQVYRGMDIGTAKSRPPRAVPYHCIDLVDPGEPYSAALYQRDARTAIDSVLERDSTVVLCGGTGLYVRAAIDDWRFPAGDTGSSFRRELEEEAESEGAEHMHERLRAADPAAADAIHPHNVRRVVRALEMAEQGTSYAEQAAAFAERRAVYDTRFVGLSMERETLYERIGERVDEMLAAGLLHEVADLLEAGFRDALTSAQAIGYKELVPVIEEGADLSHAVEDVKRATRRYAKRQLTWFRGDPRVEWVDVTGLTVEESATRVEELLESVQRHSGESEPDGA